MDIVQGCGTCALSHLPADESKEVESRPCRYARSFGNRGDDCLYGQGYEENRRVPVSYEGVCRYHSIGCHYPSYDLEHEIDATYPTEHITRELVEETLKTFIGEIQQVPPAFSACMVNGKRAYDLARKGEEVELKPKLLVIDEIELLECNLPEIKIRVVCSKGTYIRALARDIGEALNSGAHLTALERTRVGDVRLEDCLDPMDFKEWIDAQEIETEE